MELITSSSTIKWNWHTEGFSMIRWNTSCRCLVWDIPSRKEKLLCLPWWGWEANSSYRRVWFFSRKLFQQNMESEVYRRTPTSTELIPAVSFIHSLKILKVLFFKKARNMHFPHILPQLGVRDHATCFCCWRIHSTVSVFLYWPILVIHGENTF